MPFRGEAAGMARRTGRFPQLVDSRSGVNCGVSPVFRFPCTNPELRPINLNADPTCGRRHVSADQSVAAWGGSSMNREQVSKAQQKGLEEISRCLMHEPTVGVELLVCTSDENLRL